MANIAYTVNENSPETILGVEQYLSQDTDLITSFQVNNTFIPTKHLSELHILTLSDDLIESDYSYNNYKLLQNAQSAGTEGASVITVDPVQDVKLYGYDIGGVKLLYHFLNNPYGEGRTPIEFYIDSISPDRTEVRLNTLNLTSEAVLAITTNIVKNSQNRSYQDEFRLNFKNNDLLIVVNINSVQVGSDTMVAIKLYEPLPLQYGVKSVLSIVEIISDSIAYQVSTKITEAVSTAPLLSTPNFDIEVEEESVIPTGYFNYDELFSYPINNSNSQIFSTVNEKGIDISIDYSDFNNFIQFSSAQERLLNFKYKADLLNSYTISKATLSNSKKGSSGVSGSRAYYEGLIEGIVNNFDHYERHLYYESGSTSWPKSNNTKPYTINLNSTSWYQDKLEEAAAFDETSNTSLISTIPAYLREDENNQNYLTFVYMIGQHFDNLWVYTQAVTDKYDADNRLHSGISKDLVAEALKNFGVKLYTSNKSIEDLFTTFIGQEYQPGNEQINNYVVASVPTPKLNTTLIGTQTWTDRNLDVTTYRDGTPIPYEPDQAKWVSATSGAWCYPNNSSANDPIYGKLYNWYAVAGIWNEDSKTNINARKKLAPDGYRIPTDLDWTTLINHLDPTANGGTTVPNTAGGKMKATGTALWSPINTGANNSSGFTALPAGSRNISGTFISFRTNGRWWSSSEIDSIDSWARTLNHNNAIINRPRNSKKNGFSIRLLLESPTIPIPPTSLDSYQKEIYKRIYHNLPLLLKSKGTERGLRALINCFGISSDILNIKLYGGRNRETTPFFGDYTYSTSSLDKIRIDHTGSLLDGDTLSLYTSNYKREDKYTDDLHTIEVGFSPADTINTYILQSGSLLISTGDLMADFKDRVRIGGGTVENAQSLIDTLNTLQLLGTPEDSFTHSIDQFLGDPRNLQLDSYAGLDLWNNYIGQTLSRYDVKDYVRLIKFFDNTVFKMVKDFIPARSTAVTGIVIKPHILNRNKAKSVKASVNTISTASMNNAFNHTSSIDTAFSSGSDGGVFGSRNQFITSPGFVKYSTPLGKTIKQDLVEYTKYTGELPNSRIVVSTGELNSKNLFKNAAPTSLTFNVNFYKATPATICTLVTNTTPVVVQPDVEYNLPEYFTLPGRLLPDTVTYKIGTVEIPALDIGKYMFADLAQYEPRLITANAGNINNTACVASRDFRAVSCDLRTNQTVVADYINKGQTYNLTTFFNSELNTEVEYRVLINDRLATTVNSTEAKAYIFPEYAEDGDDITVKVKDIYDSDCTTSISLINKECPLGPEPQFNIFRTTVIVAALTSEAAIIPDEYLVDNLVGDKYYYREATTVTAPTGPWNWILKNTPPSVPFNFTGSGRVLQLRCVKSPGCEKIIEITKEVGVKGNKILTDLYWSNNIKQACNLGNVQGTGQLPAISDFYYVDNTKTPTKTLPKVLSEYKPLYRISGTTSTLFTGAIVYNSSIYVVIDGILSRTAGNCTTYNNPV